MFSKERILEEILRMEGISKRFGDFYANKEINLSLMKGEVHTLLGENGAGKSTLMNILAGLYQPTEGKIYLRGQETRIESPTHALRLGIGMVHQHFMLVEALTVFQNIILGDRRQKSLFIQKEKRVRDIQQLADQYGLDIQLDKKITEISVGEQQRVEILKALYRGAEILILDEPTAALTDLEVEGLYAIIERLRQEGKSIIFISHKMREVMKVSDRITVLRSGEAVATVECSTSCAQNLANLMMGHELAESAYEKKNSSDEAVIELSHVSYNKESKHSGLNDVSLVVRKGEVVGIAGVDGNGQTELAQILSGVIEPDEGELYLKGKKTSHSTPASFIEEHVAHIPEDRNRMGLVGQMSVEDNLLLKSQEKPEFCRFRGWYLRSGELRQAAENLREKYDIRCQSVEQDARSLSGGNQQKVILARELEADPDLLIAVHPTRGLDIGASQFIHDAMIEARDRGCAILMISADFDEVLELSDRILVLFEGEIMGEFPGKNPPIEAINLAMAGK